MATGGSSLSKLSDENFDFVCTACDKDNKKLEAVRYCVECLGYCCEECTELHTRFPTLRNHYLLDVGQGKQDGFQQTKLPEFPTERCCFHQGKVLDMFCETHNVIGCSTCISKDHRTCPDNEIHSIPEMIGTLFSLSYSKQIQKTLKDLMVSITSIRDAKDVQLATLKEAKIKAIKQVTKFQNALESIVKKVSEKSRKEVIDTYKKLEKEILQDKTDLKKASDVLQVTKDKLFKAEGNRAQRFVCTKIAERKITETENEISERKMNEKTDVHLSFKPNQSLMDYINYLHGTGEVAVVSRKKKDLYKVKVRKSINIKVPGDNVSSSLGCCLTFDDQLLITDYNNQKLKRVDIHTLTVIDYCKLDSQPFAVCLINEHEAVVTCHGKKIQFVSIGGNKMKPTRQIKMSHRCNGIATKDDKLYVTDFDSSLYIYDMTGNLLETLSPDETDNKLFANSKYVTFDEKEDKMYVSDWHKGIVCFDGVGKYLPTFNDIDLDSVNGICVDGRSNIFVVECCSQNIVQFNEDGKKIGVVNKEGDGLHNPCSVCYHQELNRLFVTMENSDDVKMFELE
ncbi:hypothetical protein ACF0H5_014846 [Mactra antiquata]